MSSQDKQAELDERLQLIATRIRQVADDWAEPSDGRKIYGGAVRLGIYRLREAADAAEAAIRAFGS